MSKMITFPAVVGEQTCSNCKITLDINKLLRNVVDINKDTYGMPAIMVRCPVCKTIIEWETTCN
jgi:hypothetical protein